MLDPICHKFNGNGQNDGFNWYMYTINKTSVFQLYKHKIQNKIWKVKANYNVDSKPKNLPVYEVSHMVLDNGYSSENFRASVVNNLFYDGSVDMQIWAPLTRSQCRVSVAQVTIKAHGPLVN